MFSGLAQRTAGRGGTARPVVEVLGKARRATSPSRSAQCRIATTRTRDGALRPKPATRRQGAPSARTRSSFGWSSSGSRRSPVDGRPTPPRNNPERRAGRAREGAALVTEELALGELARPAAPQFTATNGPRGAGPSSMDAARAAPCLCRSRLDEHRHRRRAPMRASRARARRAGPDVSDDGIEGRAAGRADMRSCGGDARGLRVTGILRPAPERLPGRAAAGPTARRRRRRPALAGPSGRRGLLSRRRRRRRVEAEGISAEAAEAGSRSARQVTGREGAGAAGERPRPIGRVPAGATSGPTPGRTGDDPRTPNGDRRGETDIGGAVQTPAMRKP